MKIFNKFKLLLLFTVILTGGLFLAACQDSLPTSLKVLASEDRIEILENDELNLALFTFYAVYSDGKEEVIDSSKIIVNGFNSNVNFLDQEPIKQTIEFKYLSLTKNIDIYIIPIQIESVSVLSSSGKTRYLVNESFDLTGYSLFVSYKTGENKQLDLELNHITNLEVLNLVDNKLSKAGNFELEVIYQGIKSSNSVRITVDKHQHVDEQFDVLSNITVFDPSNSYPINEAPRSAQVTVSELTGGEYKIVETLDGKYEEEAYLNALWQDSNQFINLLPNQEYAIFGRQAETNTHNSGHTYRVDVLTNPLVTPQPHIISYSYNQIEVRKDKYVNYTLNRFSKITETDNSIIFENLEPNQNYQITARYHFDSKPGQITPAQVSQTIHLVDNPFVSLGNQSREFDNQKINYQLQLRDEFAASGNIITEIRYNNSLDIPVDVGSYQVTIKHRFSPNQLTAGLFIITKKDITLKVSDVSKDYLDSDPEFSFEVLNDLPINQDKTLFNPIFNRISGESVGTYAINMQVSHPNYNISVVTGLLTINKKHIYAEVNNLTKTYGDQLTNPTYSFIGIEPSFASGDDQTFIPQFSYKTPGINTNRFLDSGIYRNEISLSLRNDSYEVEVINQGDIIVNKYQIEIDILNASKTYGQADKTFEYNLSTEAYRSQLGIVLTRESGNNVGEYEILVSRYNATNFNLDINPGFLTIAPAQITVKVNDYQITYGDDYKEKASISLLSGQMYYGDNTNSLNVSYHELQESNVGTYEIDATITHDNYLVSVIKGTLVINPKAVLITPTDNQSKVYGDNDPSFDYSVSGVINNDDVGVVLSREEGEDVGSYSFVLKETNNSNYQFNLANRQFSITSRPVTVTPINAFKTYGESDPEIEYEFKQELVNEADYLNISGNLSRAAGESVGSYQIRLNTLKVTNYQLILEPSVFVINEKVIEIDYNLKSEYVYGDLVNLTSASADILDNEYITLTGYNRDTGTHQIRAVIRNSNGQNITSNYEITNPTFELKITKAPLSIKPLVTSKVYLDNEPILRYQVVNGLQYNDHQSVLSGELLRESGDDVGSYQFILTNLQANNYYPVLSEEVKFEITKKPITITYKKEYEYTGEEQKVEINEDYDISVSSNQTLLNAGTYDITFSINDNNYELTNNSGSITIHKKVIELKINNATRKSNEANPVFTIDLEPLDGLTESFDSSDLKFTTTADENSPYGTYPIYVLEGFESDNYDFSYKTGYLTVSPPDINFEIEPNYIYNGQAQPLQITIKNDNGQDITDRFVITRSHEPVDAGSYDITITLNDGSGDIIIEQTQVIAKREITIDYKIGETFEYADPYNQNQATANNLLTNHKILLTGMNQGDRFTLGNKAITAIIQDVDNNADVTSNYLISNPSHSFEVVKGLLTITPTYTSKLFGNDDPLSIFQIEGFKRQEPNDSVTGYLSRQIGEEVGSYSFDISNLYHEFYDIQISPLASEFIINQRPITINYGLDNSYVYGSVNYELATANLRSGDKIILTKHYEVGNHIIYPTIIDSDDYDVTNNYLISNSSFSVEITTKELLITPANLSKVYGNDDPLLFSYSVSGYEYSDNDLLLGQLEREEGEVVGNYLLNLGSLEVNSNNYHLVLEEAYFTITPRTLNLTHQEENYTYHGKAQTVTLSSEELLIGDVIIISNNDTLINAGNHQLEIIIYQGDLDVTSSYDINELSIEILPKTINTIIWQYDNNIAIATSPDLVENDLFEYIDNAITTPGPHTAIIVDNPNYKIMSSQEYEYIHIGTINIETPVQTKEYTGASLEYDYTYLTELGYQVEILDQPNSIDVGEYVTQVKIEMKYYENKELFLELIIVPKEVVATSSYSESYYFMDLEYLDDNNITIEELTTDDYQIKYYQLVNNTYEEVLSFKYVGSYRVVYEVTNNNYTHGDNNYFDIEIIPLDIEVLVSDQLLITGNLHQQPSYKTSLGKTLYVEYGYEDITTDNTTIGLITGEKRVSITKISLYQNGENVIDQFNVIDASYFYTEISYNYLSLANYNKDDYDRDEANKFANDLMEATKNPVIGVGYRYPNVYYASLYEDSQLNPLFSNFNSNYYYKFGNLNNTVIYLDGLIDFESLEFDNIQINGQGITLIGLKKLDFTNDFEIHEAARNIYYGLEVKFDTVGKQMITISYQKHGKELILGKLNVEVIDGFTNIIKYEDLFDNSNNTIQDVVLNNGIAYKKGGTNGNATGSSIIVNENKTFYGNNYEVNAYSSSYPNLDNPPLGAATLMQLYGTLDNARIIQRRVTTYASAGHQTASINADTALRFGSGVIKNSFISNGRETVEIVGSNNLTRVIEDSTILGGPFGIRQRGSGTIVLNNVKVIERPDKDLGGMGIPIVFLNNSGTNINELPVNDIKLIMDSKTKIYAFETLDNIKNATLPTGAKEVVADIIDELWQEHSSYLGYNRGGDLVMSPAILFVSPEPILDELEQRNPIEGFVSTFRWAHKSITIASGYGYVFTYNNEEYSQTEVENLGILNAPSYHEFHGEYKGEQ